MTYQEFTRMIRNHSLTARLRHTAALSLFVVSGSLCLHAQQNSQNTMVAELHQPVNFDLGSAAIDAAPLNLTDDGVAYSSSTGSNELAAAEGFSFGKTSSDASQPPPRRRYGRPNFSDRMHNADGSNKLAFLIGGGFTAPVGDVSTKYLKTSWKVQGGVGYNFNKRFGVIAQFDWDNFALPGSLITSQRNFYATQGFTYSDGTTVDFTGLDGHTHDWSFTLNPTMTFYQGDSLGAYAVVGGGFYHKVTNFTLPQTGTYCDFFFGCFQYQANQTFDKYTSNSAGINGGAGITYRPSRFASERLYAEVRYVFNFNEQKQGSFTNLFPGNSATTSYIPVTVGVRF